MVHVKLLPVLTLLMGGTVALAAPTKNNVLKRASGKAGISWPVQEQAVEPLTKFFGDGSTLSWFHDWNKNWGPGIFPLDPTPPVINAEFVPMQYDAQMLNDKDPLQAGWTEIMGYNEPDMTTTAGVSTPVDAATAAADWKTMVTQMKAINPNAKIWSPAVASNKAWLTSFFAAICPTGLAGCEFAPSHLVVHIYDTDVGAFQAQVNDYHTTYGLPIVVSEFACYKFDGSHPAITADQASDYMSHVVTWMDGIDWIYKYAWFGAVRNAKWLVEVPETNRLMDAAGNLTPLGQQYIAGGRK